MVRPSSVDPDMVNKCVKYLKKHPDLKVPAAMKQTNFSPKEVANLSFHCLICQSLPGKTMTSLKAHALLSLPPQPDRAERRLNRAIGDEGAVVEPGSRSCAIAHTLFPLLPQPPRLAMPQGGSSSSAVSTALAALTEVESRILPKKEKSKAVNSTTTTTRRLHHQQWPRWMTGYVVSTKQCDGVMLQIKW